MKPTSIFDNHCHRNNTN